MWIIFHIFVSDLKNKKKYGVFNFNTINLNNSLSDRPKSNNQNDCLPINWVICGNQFLDRFIKVDFI